MKKVIYLMILLMFGFGCFTVVNAEEEGMPEEEPTEEVEENTEYDNFEGEVKEYSDEEGGSDNLPTGLNDYMMYITPVLIIGGATILIKRDSFN